MCCGTVPPAAPPGKARDARRLAAPERILAAPFSAHHQGETLQGFTAGSVLGDRTHLSCTLQTYERFIPVVETGSARLQPQGPLCIAGVSE